MARECGDCTKCCEGYLHGEVKEIKFYLGTPCHFLKSRNKNKACSIYNQRPLMCSNFKCLWLVDESIPEWIKPSVSNTIISMQAYDEIQYIELIEAGARMDPSVLSWVIMKAVNNKINLKYIVDGGVYKIGEDRFWKNKNI